MDAAAASQYIPDMAPRTFPDRATPPHILTLILLSGLGALSMNVFLPSLPSMTAYFDTEYRIIQLSIAVYLGMSAGLQILIGPVSDNIGRRPVLLWSLALFLLATLGCIYAPTAEIFLLCRMGQAVAATTLVLTRAIVRDLFEQDEAASKIGYVTMGMSIVPMIGPMLGGLFDQMFGWQSNFWLMFAVGALILALVWGDLGETKLSSGLSLAAQFREYPELLRSPRFWGYSMAAALTSGSFFAYLGGAPFVGTQVFGMTPGMLGLFFGAPAVGYLLGNFLTGRYATRIGVNRMVLAGCLANAAGSALSLVIILSGYGTMYTFFGLMTFVGVGNGLALPNAMSGMLSVRPHLAGTASGLGGAIQIGGGAALSALAGWMLVEGTGGAPLLWLMTLTAIGGILSILAVMRRERMIGV
jgi:DHA1 family bicyclomycin/chloramphenicol resistance-like MFS transporter